MADVAAVEAVEPVRRRRRRHASASGNNGGDNDSSDEDVAKERSSFKVPPSLEDAAIDAYLTYLESEVVAYIGLTQTDSKVLRGVTARMLASLKAQINSTMSGIASSVIRQKMLKIILSDRFPSPQYCNMFIGKPDDDEDDEVAHLPRQGLYSNCPNSCCTGAFIQEAMAGIIMSADIHELIFTNESVKSRRPQTCLEFNVPVVLTHLLSATHQHFSQLERIIFSENFVKDDSDEAVANKFRCLVHNHHHGDPMSCPRGILDNQIRRQERFAKHFAAAPTHDSTILDPYCSPDRLGLAMGLMVMFRDVAPRSPLSKGDLGLAGFYKLTEIVLRNNIQCQVYSKASFQFELLARIGFCCPRLKVLDLFGTDTWADCLVAFFFRDAFHSLHRYLFFMENEEDEDSAYHPHDLSRYCQFCLDRLSHPGMGAVERPFTINPVIPLIDPIYDHVIKKYPKRSYCILRNCVKVSDLINCPKSTVFELLRPPNMEPDPLKINPPSRSARKPDSGDESDDNGVEVIDSCNDEDEEEVGSIRTRLRSSFQRQVRKKATKRKGKTYTILSAHEKPITVFPIKQQNRRSSRLKAKSPAAAEETSKVIKDQALMSLDCLTLKSDSKGKKTEETSTSLPGQTTAKIMTRSRKRQMIESRQSRVKVAKMTEVNVEPNQSKQPNILRTVPFEIWQQETNEKWREQQSKPCCRLAKNDFCDDCSDYSEFLQQTKNVSYREISGWPHLNDCIETLELLNIGGTNVLGEFIPFILLYTKKLKSLGQWINTMIYGLEILRQLPGNSTIQFPQIHEFSYSTDRNYFCQPYIGFVPESAEYRNVRKEMVRQSSRVAKRLSHSVRNHAAKKKQIHDDINLMVDACPNVFKLNMVLHHKLRVIEEHVDYPWQGLSAWKNLKELDLVTFRFANVWSLLELIGPQLETLTLELDDEQGNGSEIVHIARNCSNLKSLRLLIGHKILRGEMTLHFGTPFFRNLERLTVEGSVHLHGFAFLWGHCRNLQYMRIGNVVSNEVNTSNVLIYDVFNLLFQVNKMEQLEEFHIKNLKIKSFQMGKFLLDNLPKLKKASNWILDMFNLSEIREVKKLIETAQSKGLVLEVTEET